MKTADESGSWSQVYNYDAFGNRWVSANHTLSFATPTAQSQFDAATNRLTKTFDGTPLPADAYDAAGNLTKHAWVGVMAYDANNLQRYYCTSAAAACTAANADAEYQYDGDGRRVKKLQGMRTTVFVYDAFGNLAAEYDTQPDPNLVAGTYYRTTDHLGSTRLVTNATGGVVSRRDYFPFGEEIPANATFGNRQMVTDGGTTTTYNKEVGVYQKFTGKEHDEESDLDYFAARHLSSPQGRFTSADPVHILKQKLLDPQQWNMYAYVRNHPLTFRDPTGKYVCNGTDEQCEAFERTRQKVLESKNNAGARRGGAAYGDPGARNGVVVTFADKITSGKSDRGGTVQPTGTGIEGNPNDNTKVQATLLVTIQTKQINNVGTVAHEGSHVADHQDFINSVNAGGVFNQALNITRRETETTAYGISVAISQAGNDTLNYGPCGMMKECKFTPGMMPVLRDQTIQDLLNDPRQGYKDLDEVLYPQPFFRNQ